MPIDAAENAWILEMKSAAYALAVDPAGVLAHRYWGPRLPYREDYPPASSPHSWASFDMASNLTREEYPCYAGTRYVEPCLKVTFCDGVRDVVPRFTHAELDGDNATLRLHLRDAYYPFEITLHYRAHVAYDLLERWATLTNQGDAPVVLERAWSAQWHLPPGEHYRLTHLAGRWSDEMHLQRDQLTSGVVRLESRRLATGHQHANWFAIDRGTASENAGEVWFGALAWSGNFAMAAESTAFTSTRVSIGLNDWDFAWQLQPGESFSTPSSIGGFSAQGFTGASQQLHDYIRDHVLPHGAAVHKVLYNSWEATGFQVSEQSQRTLAKRAAAIGVELFILDDGWFHGRDDDAAALGDWWPDERKFPNGLAPLIASVNELGMDFGLWIEPEMVNARSELYRAHPDWVIHFPTRARSEARQQMILNLARADVQEYLIAQLDALLTQNNIAFVKWDMNRNVSEPGWPDAPGDQREIWVRYVQGLYHVWATLRERHPGVIWQTCAGGGGRVDLGILRLADQAWTSDNTDGVARLGIQEGYSYAYPACTMEAWATDASPAYVPLSFRFHSSMCGVLGVGGDLLRWSDEMCAEAAALIEQYKQVRHIVHQGDQFRLGSPQSEACTGVLYLTKDRTEGVLFAFRTFVPFPAQMPPLFPRGLLPTILYEFEGIPGQKSGLAWEQAGIALGLGNFESTMRLVRAVEL